jgi:hypothetical protein
MSAWVEKDYKEKVEEMLQCKDFKDLVVKYGNQKKMLAQYNEQKKFAPDGIVVIENNIRDLENYIRSLPNSMTVTNKYTGAEHFTDTYFEKLGYEWVKNGYNADRNTIRAFVIFREPDPRAWLPSNFLLARSVPTKEWAINNYRILMQLAKGGATAFYVGYLKDELKRVRGNLLSPTDTVNSISKNEHVILKLLEQMELILITNENKIICNVKEGRGTTLFATIDAIKEHSMSLLNRSSYSDNDLLKAFNNTLGLSFQQLRRNGASFENDKLAAIAKIKNLLRK